ncbi:MAG TPA: sulfur globule protein precursor [Beijerinckiaceae bacterium]|jgi:hypothetical protein|nr:sulfur globule protein precursor [Beijerinckiaceae bacterium]
MFSLPGLRKLTLAVATVAAVAAPLALSTAASARVIYHRGPVRVYHGPRFYPGRAFYRGPRFYGAPVYAPYPAYRCYTNRKWVPGPFGYHWATNHQCY